jgi:hypothetical protein
MSGRSREKVTLQISLAPTDLPTAMHIVPHQLRAWAAHVDEILLVLNLRRGAGRYGVEWAERLPGIRRLIDDICSRFAHARIAEVDYSEAVVDRLSSTYFGGTRLPALDCNGGPFHAYLFAIEEARHDLIFHCDSDMIYGGEPGPWLNEARDLLAGRENVITVSPLPGPPASDGRLHSQAQALEPGMPYAYRADKMSTRHFLLDRRKLRRGVAPLAVTRPEAHRSITAWLDGMPPVKPLEELISDRMRARGLVRIEFLGRTPGLWSVHPAYRGEAFYRSLPRVLADVDQGNIPEGQRGYHDLNESMTDWTGAKATRFRRTIGHVRTAARRLVGALRTETENTT